MMYRRFVRKHYKAQATLSFSMFAFESNVAW